MLSAGIPGFPVLHGCAKLAEPITLSKPEVTRALAHPVCRTSRVFSSHTTTLALSTSKSPVDLIWVTDCNMEHFAVRNSFYTSPPGINREPPFQTRLAPLLRSSIKHAKGDAEDPSVDEDPGYLPLSDESQRDNLQPTPQRSKCHNKNTATLKNRNNKNLVNYCKVPNDDIYLNNYHLCYCSKNYYLSSNHISPNSRVMV